MYGSNYYGIQISPIVSLPLFDFLMCLNCLTLNLKLSITYVIRSLLVILHVDETFIFSNIG